MSWLEDFSIWCRENKRDPESSQARFDFERGNGGTAMSAGGASLEEIAVLLGGEFDGRNVRAPSPGRPRSDRSMVVRIDAASPNHFYIYACEGSVGAAYAHVRERLKFAASPAASKAEKIALAMRIWEKAKPACGTLMESYLRSRAITIPIPPRLRFHDMLKHQPTDGWRPAMVALVTGRDDRPVAVHRTFLNRDGSGKAPVEPDRMTLGPIAGAAVRLAPVAARLAVGEGIETCLSVMQETGLPTWAALSTTGLKLLELPDVVREVVILADGDDEGEAAARAAALRWKREGRRVQIARPPRGLDFNDMIRGRRPMKGDAA